MRQQKAETVGRVSNLALYCMVEMSGGGGETKEQAALMVTTQP